MELSLLHHKKSFCFDFYFHSSTSSHTCINQLPNPCCNYIDDGIALADTYVGPKESFLKVLVLIQSLIPQLFSNISRFRYQKLSHIEGLCIKFYTQSLCCLGGISKKPSLKLANMVTTIYSTISNINIVFSNF